MAFPAALLLVSLALQFGLYLHAAQIAEAVAQEAIDAAQGETDGAAVGTTTARMLLADLPALRGAQVSVDRGPTTVTARVTGRAPAFVPGVDLRIAASASGPAERFVPQP